MTTHFVTLIQSAERGTRSAPQCRADRFVPRSGLRELAFRWLRFGPRPAGSREQHLAA